MENCTPEVRHQGYPANDLRHAYATYSIRSGANIKTSAEIMGHENARMILEVYEHVDWAQKVRAIEGMPDFFALAPKAVRNPIHERRPRKREIDEPGAKYCVRNTVPALNDRKHLIHSEIENQYGNPAIKTLIISAMPKHRIRADLNAVAKKNAGTSMNFPNRHNRKS